MKNKGFTLVELLAVIVIMGIILLVAIPSVFGISKVVKDNMFCTKVHNLESAAKLYGGDYQDDFDDRGYIKVDVKTIIDNNLYKKETDECTLGDEDKGCVVDPRDESVMDNKTVTIVKTGQRYYAYYDFDKEEDITLCEGKKETDKYKHYDVALDNQGATYPGTTIVRDVVFGHEMPKIDVPKKIYTVKLIDKLTNYYKEEKVEYTFRGYFAAKNGGVKYYDENGINVHYYNLPDGRPLYAVWTDKSVNIPKRTFTGYVFQGWYNAETDGNLITEGGNYIPTSDITLYARWIPKEVTLTLDSQSATFKGTEKVTATYNVKVPDIETIPRKEYNVTLNYNYDDRTETKMVAYTFDGYYSQRNGKGTPYYDGAGKGIETSLFTSGATLYAYWNNSYKLPVPVREGYSFEGWYTAATGGTKVSDGGIVYNASKNITLYAHWKMSYAILERGVDFSLDIKKLSKTTQYYSSYNLKDVVIKNIMRSSTPPPKNMETRNVADDSSGVPIYAWFDNGTIYLYTTNSKIFLNEDASYMFYYLYGLTSLDLSIFDSSMVRSLRHFLSDLENLTSLNISTFDTSNVVDMCALFYSLPSLKTLDVSNFNTSKVTDMSFMFYHLDLIENLNVSNLDTSNVTNMDAMFYYLSSLKSIDVSNFNTSKVTDMSFMFYRNESLTNLDLNMFDTSNVTEMRAMFYESKKLKNISLSNFDTSNVTDMSWMFYDCSGLTSISLKNFNTSKVTTMKRMFYRLAKITDLDLSNFDTSKVTDMSFMFNDCRKLINLNISSFDTSKVTNMNGMFGDLYSMTSLDLRHFDTSNVTDMGRMFEGNSYLTSLNISSFNTSKVTKMGGMFYGCYYMKSLDLRHFDTSNVVDMGTMFYNCGNLTSLNVSSFNTSNVTNMSAMFAHCKSLENLNIKNFNTSKVTDMAGMFDSMDKIKVLDISNFDTSSLKTVTAAWAKGDSSSTWRSSHNFNMFGYMKSLTTIYVGDKWDISNVESSDEVFDESKNLRGGAGTVFNASHIGTDYMHVDGGTSNPGYLTRK